MKSERNEHESKLAALRTRLQEGEDSPLVEDFDPEEYLRELNDQYTRDS
ncbi:MAG: type II toxin-antitoxin system ParD family antitoxin [Candidatus Thiodiazotropha taylori]|nr:type II toxin-antitoxin system ParD family antitoxin [Candidatus Thiodiazotropha taylori]MCG8094592.1 type II toxin-antitoxin system ParD family antitoxin [Candidatus Thiodiazotropha endolucinida]MCG7883140.1 type II toxin-antitoxin system ParD family antitoxin [Candidatus Thiodiazotropha taylori]MCG7888327.1 type II toxin-antitoxin system ParD family antitoxin [Candidatus Thiodiazotropha taylori]MCG7890750.1 type II toxin-antitoxin system ParD family antitoxin [Candidatus Thiodiazotropha ta